MSQRDVLLIANVGNHDVKLEEAGHAFLPAPPEERWFPRTLGEAILDRFERCAPYLRFDLLTPVFTYLREKHFSDVENGLWDRLHVVLFASDQSEEAGEAHKKDTMPFAKVIQRALKQTYEIPGEKWRVTIPNVLTIPIEGNPADYANMLSFYVPQLKKRRAYFRQKEEAIPHVYMEVSGGTPAMTSMLIVAGVEVFGENVHVLYVPWGVGLAQEVRIAGQIFGQKVRNTFTHQIQEHSYTAALHTLNRDGKHVARDPERLEALIALVHYVERRLEFDFQNARRALQRAYSALRGNVQAVVGNWLRALQKAEEVDHLAELWHGMYIELDLQRYAAFVQRAFVFQERTFRHIATQMGVQTHAEGRQLDPDWVNAQEGLVDFMEKRKVEWWRTLNRVILSTVIAYFMERQPTFWGHLERPIQSLNQLSAVAGLRNSGLAGHGLKGISQAAIEQAYGASLEKLMDDLADVYQDVFGQAVGPSPYQEAEDLILGLISD